MAEKLIKKRSSMKAKLTSFSNYLEILKSCDNLSELQRLELSGRFNKFDALYSEFDELQTEIELLTDKPEEAYEVRAQFETQYHAMFALAQSLMSSADVKAREGFMTGSEGSTSGGTRNNFIRLPKIDLPHFDGGYQYWLEFRDTYLSLIHQNSSIDNISKFHYLRASLKGTAAEIIRNIDFKSDQYNLAWDLLCDRFNNSRLLVNNHVQALFNFEPISRESSTSLRQLIDVTNKNIRALKALNEPTQHWDTLIIYMMSLKLDPTTSRHWEEYRNTITSAPKLSQFCTFLSNRADLLETLQENNKSINKLNKSEHYKNKNFLITSKNNIQQNKNSKQLQSITTTCPLCTQNHFLYSCESFRQLPIEARIKKAREFKVCINCLRIGHVENRCKLSHCKYCKSKHNTLLHLDKPESFQNPMPLSSQLENIALPANTSLALPANTSPMQHTTRSYVLLSTAYVRAVGSDGKKCDARLLLDNGSTANFISEDLCSKLGVNRHSAFSTTVTGINNQISNSTQSCNLTIESFYGDYSFNIDCLILPEITKRLPSSLINIDHINIPTNIRLADPTFNIPSVIDILVGAEVFWSIIQCTHIDLGKNQPKLCESKLGWIVTGCISTKVSHNLKFCNFTKADNTFDLSKFWELDKIPTKYSLTSEERACEESFNENTFRNSDGRFVVTIPLKANPDVLGDSFHIAKRRFLSLERRFERDLDFKKMYVNFMSEYENLGHMIEDKDFSFGVNYFLPHHGVTRETSTTTKLRTVFDASAKTTSGLSLNDIQMVGPVVQDDLLSILLRFRQHRYAVTGDIEKMYRAIELNSSQHSLQRIVFRNNATEPLKTFKLTTLTYGFASASYLATKCLVSLADKVVDDNVKNSIQRDFYVDDYLSGSDTISGAIKLCKEVSSILSKAKFNLRKWQSNSPEILKETTKNNLQNNNILNIPHSKTSSKTLGLIWYCDTDSFSFSINVNLHTKVTKRNILSVVSQIFDPLGLVGPCVIDAKIIMQSLWVNKCEWDEELSHDLASQWYSFYSTLNHLNKLKIPRWVSCAYNINDIHVFTDASEKAYGACLYVRTVDDSGVVTVNLLTAKSRVAPIKPTTTPRLELCAALLGTRLCTKVKESLTIPIRTCRFWCDSTIVLGWLSTSANQLKQFVRNRANEIQESTSGCTWSYVASKENPADILSRGLKADLISSSKLWWSGPPFLLQNQNTWPCMPNKRDKQQLPDILSNFSNTNEIDKHSTLNQNILTQLIYQHSKLTYLQRIVAYILRFINNLKLKQNKTLGPLTQKELQISLNYIIKAAQIEMFPEEYNLLQSNKSLPRKNRLISLTPFLDSDGLIRVGGRLDNSPYDYNVKHPILLCSKHHFTKILFEMLHKRLLHAGPQLLLANVRQTYWPLGGRNLSKSILKNCVICFRHKAQGTQPIMGQLPAHRTTLEFPFINSSVDYSGPILIADRRGRGCKLIKSYLCIFVCLAVKAVHLELVTSLTKESYMAALNRFIARRGKPRTILSDNGTNFIGASNELRALLQNADLASSIADEGIEFSFTPPYSPHFNGIAEAAVRSTKNHLTKLLKHANFTYEELYTSLTQIESILNSRPLTPLSDDPLDYCALTPAHFLIGRPLLSLPHPPLTDIDATRLDHYKRVEQIKQHFWNRFSLEYINLLQQRTKWSTSSGDLKEGALVIIKDKALPPLMWSLGRITQVFPGRDGVTRVAEIKTKRGTVRRAFNNICPLPL